MRVRVERENPLKGAQNKKTGTNVSVFLFVLVTKLLNHKK
jgi:hypothetical protein